MIGTWRWPFALLLIAGLAGMAWSAVRLPETRRPSDRAPFSVANLAMAFRLVVATPQTLGYTIAGGFVIGCLMSYIASAQQVFGEAYALGAKFPLAFGGLAISVALASYVNAHLVGRLGMRRVSHTALVGFCVVSLALVAMSLGGRPPFWLFAPTLALGFFMFGQIMPNFNALALEPMGRIAGSASSFTGFYITASGALFGAVIGRMFDGTPLPLSLGFATLGGLALLTVLAIEGRKGLFRNDLPQP